MDIHLKSKPGERSNEVSATAALSRIFDVAAYFGGDEVILEEGPEATPSPKQVGGVDIDY